MHWLGLSGMPGRIPDYPTAFAGWNLICSYGAYVSVASLVAFFVVVADALIAAMHHVALGTATLDQCQYIHWNGC